MINLDTLQADAITGDLRTNKNTLSFWAVNDIDELKKAVVALSFMPVSTDLEKIDVIWIDDKDLTQQGLVIEPTKGKTAAIRHIDIHRDVCNLTYSSLGIVASAVMNAIHSGCYKRIGATMVKDYAKEALINGEIDTNLCDPKLKVKLSKL